MESNRGARTIDAIFALLAEERVALIEGDFPRLEELAKTKEDLLARLQADPGVGQQDLLPLQENLSRNQRLLTSAMGGIQSVMNRLEDLRRVRQRLETYDRSGKKNPAGVRINPSIEKRA